MQYSSTIILMVFKIKGRVLESRERDWEGERDRKKYGKVLALVIWFCSIYLRYTSRNYCVMRSLDVFRRVSNSAISQWQSFDIDCELIGHVTSQEWRKNQIFFCLFKFHRLLFPLFSWYKNGCNKLKVILPSLDSWSYTHCWLLLYRQ
jgi:hypothetical protein